ncbi:hypothetical protein K0B96_07080 [Horticoccus luteus]|uniref:Glycoside hydrolase family 38 central domain-containing protein n=1 Tax=Horticoccus luteus TaxID=2862869 RepID=A0A8F9XIG2_9BACT|nr:alpha-mannosidase [Horticoccus luteus]QYM80365.1 hypothetical protein K0B96_07080 [Horticoccus luteus]
MRTVHLIFNAHLDPVWLWPWTAGVDETLNTCVSMCDFLDRHPDVIFTRGEAWVYEQVRRHDPVLFQRIVQHIRAGRWSVVGGWWIQPDCNLPGEEGFHQQITLGRDWFKRHLGLFPRIGYNVDSFGHSAALPDLMAAHGQRSYVFMRPMKHERTLPARVFRWRGRPGGAEITAFRIAAGYCTIFPPTLDLVEQSLSELPSGVDDTMCFLGVGDHGGGPNEAILEWTRRLPDLMPGTRFLYSSPEKYFRALAPQVKRLPLVTGELQMHAIGCYSVHRPVKVGVRRAENLLAQARRVLATASPAERRAAQPALRGAWEQVCFNHFHDTLGGSSIQTANRPAEEQLGGAAAAAETVLSETFRRRAHALPPDPRQRLAFGNFSGAPFSDWCEHEPWLEWSVWQPDWCLLDARGRVVPHQLIAAEALMPDALRLLFPLRVAAGDIASLRIARRPAGKAPKLTGPSPAFTITRAKKLQPTAGATLALPEFVLVEDKSDTWSHNLDRFAGPIVGRAAWSAPEQVEDGPLRCTWRTTAPIGESTLCADWRRYRGSEFWELRLRVAWHEHHKILRLSWRPGARIQSRNDGISVGGLARTSDGAERPVRDRSLLQLDNGQRAGVVAPDVFSLAGDHDALHLTLLRSCPLAHHDPLVLPPHLPHVNWADQGDHTFLLRFFAAGRVTAAQLDRHALHLQQRPVAADLTRGMPFRPFKDDPNRPL